MTLQDALIFADDEMEADWAHRVLAKEITRLRTEVISMATEMNRALAEAEMAGHDADALQVERDAAKAEVEAAFRAGYAVGSEGDSPDTEWADYQRKREGTR